MKIVEDKSKIALFYISTIKIFAFSLKMSFVSKCDVGTF